MKPGPITTTHEVMTCPACLLTITAKVEVEVDLGKPELAPDMKHVEVSAHPRLRRFSINHSCAGPVEPEEQRESVSA
jgi:hypothetical protein